MPMVTGTFSGGPGGATGSSMVSRWGRGGRSPGVGGRATGACMGSGAGQGASSRMQSDCCWTQRENDDQAWRLERRVRRRRRRRRLPPALSSPAMRMICGEVPADWCVG